MAFHTTNRNKFIILIATFLFVIIYTFIDFPEPLFKDNVDTSGFNYNIRVSIEEVLNTLYKQNQTSCDHHRYDARTRDRWSATAPSGGKPVLYRPPCPLGDYDDFRFLNNRDICGDDEVYMLVLVGSHPRHLDIRNVIRSTYGNPGIPNFPFRVAFLFGHVEDEAQQRLLEEESRNYSDVLQGSFVDSYHNVTLRDLMGFRWAWKYCSQAKFVMKVDDDVSIDIFALIDVLEERFGADPEDFVGCFQMMVDTPVLRSERYAVSKSEHPADTYAPYCQGWMYVLTVHMAYSLDLAAMRVKPYWMNDAYLTGTLVKALGMAPLDLRVNYTIHVLEMKNVESRDPGLQPLYTVGPTGRDEKLIFNLHQNYKYYASQNGLPKHTWTKIAKTRSTKTATTTAATHLNNVNNKTDINYIEPL